MYVYIAEGLLYFHQVADDLKILYKKKQQLKNRQSVQFFFYKRLSDVFKKLYAFLWDHEEPGE